MAHTISTHVLDTETGRPAAGLPVRLARVLADGALIPAGSGRTDDDGRIAELLEGELVAGTYRVTFEVHQYRAQCFFREVTLDVAIDDVARSYHVPLLVAPYGISSYRGS
ncbi:MAG: hydroxyisourate hydrolase [Chloroflexota bacterium]